jgi:hypothetical protein
MKCRMQNSEFRNEKLQNPEHFCILHSEFRITGVIPQCPFVIS